MSRVPGRQVGFPFIPRQVSAPAVAQTNAEALNEVFKTIGVGAGVILGAQKAKTQIEIQEEEVARDTQAIETAKASIEFVTAQQQAQQQRDDGVRATLMGSEAKLNYDEIVKLERNRIPAYMATLNDAELNDFLREHPGFSPANDQILGELAGTRIAAGHVEEILDTLRTNISEQLDAARENPEELERLLAGGSLAGLEISEVLGELSEQMQGLPDAVRGAWGRSITGRMKDAVRTAVIEEARDQQRLNLIESDQVLQFQMQSILNAAVPPSDLTDPESETRKAMERWAAVRGVPIEQAEEQAASAMRESFLLRLRGPEDPHDLLHVIEAIDHRSSFWRRFENSPVGSIEAIAKAEVQRRSLATDQAARDRIVRTTQDLRRQRNMEGLEQQKRAAAEIKNPAIREEAQIQAQSMIDDLRIVDGNVNAAADYVTDTKRKGDRPSLAVSEADELLDRMQSLKRQTYEQALEGIASAYGLVPPRAKRQIEGQLSSASRDRDVPSGLAGLRAIDNGNPFLADQLAEGVGLFGRMSWRVTKGVDPNSQRYLQIIGSLNGPNSRTGSALAANLLLGRLDKADPSGAIARDQQQLAQALKDPSMIGQLFAQSGPYQSLREVFPSPDASTISAFEDHFRLAVIENLDAGVPQDTVGEVAARDAVERLRADKEAVVVNGRPYYMERGQFSLAGDPISAPRDLVFASQAVSEWESQIQTDRPDVFARPDRSVTLLGKRYIGAIGVDVDADSPGVGLAGILWVSIGARTSTELNRGEDPVLFDKIEGLMLWDMDVDDADRFARFRWKPAMGAPSITLAQTRLGAQWVGDLGAALEDAWEEQYGAAPSRQDPEFVEFSMERLRSWGWTGNTR